MEEIKRDNYKAEVWLYSATTSQLASTALANSPLLSPPMILLTIIKEHRLFFSFFQPVSVHLGANTGHWRYMATNR